MILATVLAPGAQERCDGAMIEHDSGVAGVPSGTCYVRIRAGNYTGLGPASNAVIVTVP